MSQTLVFFAQKAFIISDGDLLVVRRSPDDPNSAGFWEVPGGRIELGESLDDHIRREVKEETGLIIEPGAPFYVWQWTIKAKEVGMSSPTVIAVARICTTTSRTLDDRGRVSDDFLGEMKWVNLTELQTINWIPNMLNVVNSFQQIVKATNATTP